ncbi:MAG: hypothetical protein GXY41_03720 [Phycisphaerae bacterium]|nr:hypothetical protein [Phycisphaerae bacterium]
MAKRRLKSGQRQTEGVQTSSRSGIWRYLVTFTLGVLTTASVSLFTSQKFHQQEITPLMSSFGHNVIQRSQDIDSKAGSRSVMELLALPEEKLSKVDILELNLAVAREIKGLENLDYNHYKQVVDSWTQQFLQWLPVVEQEFYQNPGKWENDINFARMGALAQWLDQAGGIAYIEEQKKAKEVQYTDPSHLLVYGLIDTKRGTCGNMSVLHVAMGRRCGWPVSLACVNAHYICRYDDGKNIYNFETTDTGRGGFAMERDEGYIKEFNLSKRAISSGSDLRSLTARETLAVFVNLRARYYRDTNQMDLADRDYSLARAIFPNYRKLNTMALPCYVWRASELFEPGEFGHPTSFFSYLNSQFPAERRYIPPQHTIDDVMRMNEANRRRMEAQNPSVRPPVSNPGVPPLTGPMIP